MKFLFLPALILLATITFSQENELTKEELKTFSKLERGLIDFRYDKKLNSYVYINQLIQQTGYSPKEPFIKMIGFIKMTKKGDDYCFGDATLQFNLKYKNVTPLQYDHISVSIGHPATISNGDPIKYEFDVEADAEGTAHIKGMDVIEFISKGSEENKPITIKFSDTGQLLGELTITANKLKQKLGGLAATFKNLGQKFVHCDSFD